MDSATAVDMESVVVSKVTWRLIPFLFLLYIVAYLDRINVGFAALQMQQELGFNDAMYGLGAGMFFAGYFVFQLPSNLILQKVGARRWVAIIMVFWGIISSCMIFVRTAHGFYALRFTLGVAEAGFFPGVILYLKTWFPAAAQARTVARFMTAGVLSGVVGGPISGALLGLDRVGGMAGWQWLFLVEGIPAIILGAVVLRFLTDYPKDAHWLEPEHRAWLVDTLKREKDSHPASVHKNVFAVFANGGVWFYILLMVIVYFGCNMFSYGVSLWLPKVIRSLSGVNAFVIGLISTIPYIAAAIAMTIAGLHSDRTGERKWHVVLPALVAAVSMVAAAYSGSLTLTITALSLGLMGVWSMYGPFWAIPSSLVTGTSAAVAIAVVNSFGNLGGFYGPYIIGKLRTQTGEFRGGFLVIGAGLLVSAAAASLIRVHQRAAQRS